MFRKSVTHKQGDLFSGIPSILEGKSLNHYNNTEAWHNQFRKQILSRIDESIFKVLYSENMGAPNSPVSVLLGMIILKDAFGWSDSQLFEHCRFNLLVRSALGFFNLNDEIPTESTYYLFRQQVHQYMHGHGEDLFQKAFETVTQGQIQEFEVSGKSIRMDSKLFGSNIAWFSRYEIIHQTFVLFCKTLDESDFSPFSEEEKQQLGHLLKEEPLKTIYRSTKEDIQTRMQSIGILTYKTLQLFSNNNNSEAYQLLQRVFREQYTVGGDGQKVALRPKEEIASDSVQSPHDPDSAYRHKTDQKVKGYSMNVTETISDGPLDLITNVIVDKANVSDTAFVVPGISATQTITDERVETVYTDGAYQSPSNDDFCQNIDMVFTGIQGAVSRYDLEMFPEGLLVIDTQTGERLQATLAKKQKNNKEDRWFIRTGKDKVYFNQKAIRTANLRRTMKQRPIEELQKRNNVEATIFHVGYPLRNSKSKYRGLVKNQIWAICRCFWVNLVRIVHYLEQTCQRTLLKSGNAAFAFNLWFDNSFLTSNYNKLSRNLSFFVIVIFYNKFNPSFKNYFSE